MIYKIILSTTTFIILWVIMSKIESFFRALFDYSAFNPIDRHEFTYHQVKGKTNLESNSILIPNNNTNILSNQRLMLKEDQQPAANPNKFSPPDDTNMTKNISNVKGIVDKSSISPSRTINKNGKEVGNNSNTNVDPMPSIQSRRSSGIRSRNLKESERALMQIERSMNVGSEGSTNNPMSEVQTTTTIYKSNGNVSSSSDAAPTSYHPQSSIARRVKPNSTIEEHTGSSGVSGGHHLIKTLSSHPSSTGGGIPKVQDLINMHQNKIGYNKNWKVGESSSTHGGMMDMNLSAPKTSYYTQSQAPNLGVKQPAIQKSMNPKRLTDNAFKYFAAEQNGFKIREEGEGDPENWRNGESKQSLSTNSNGNSTTTLIPILRINSNKHDDYKTTNPDASSTTAEFVDSAVTNATPKLSTESTAVPLPHNPKPGLQINEKVDAHLTTTGSDRNQGGQWKGASAGNLNGSAGNVLLRKKILPPSIAEEEFDENDSSLTNTGSRISRPSERVIAAKFPPKRYETEESASNGRRLSFESSSDRRLKDLSPLSHNRALVFYPNGRRNVVAVITGGSRGLGRSIVLKLYEVFLDSYFRLNDPDGASYNTNNGAIIETNKPSGKTANLATDYDSSCTYDIILTCRDPRCNLVKEMERELEQIIHEKKITVGNSFYSSFSTPPISIRQHPLDLSSVESIKVLKNFILKEYGGGIDILVNNAAICIENAGFLSTSRATQELDISRNNPLNRQNTYRRSYRRNSINGEPAAYTSQNKPTADSDIKNNFETADNIMLSVDKNRREEKQPGGTLLEEEEQEEQQTLTDYEIADLTFQTNFWRLQELCNALFPFLKPDARVVNITCSAGSARNVRNPKIRSRLCATVNTDIDMPEATLNSEMTHSKDNIQKAANPTTTSSTVKSGSGTWFNSSYFNLEFFTGAANKTNNQGEEINQSTVNGDMMASKDRTTSDSVDDTAVMNFEELRQLVNSYLASTKRLTRTHDGWSGTHYSVSKMAVTVLTAIQQRILDRAQPFKNVLVNSCCPGYIKTSLNGYKGYVDDLKQASETPVFLAVLPPSTDSPRGRFVYQKRVKLWT